MADSQAKPLPDHFAKSDIKQHIDRIELLLGTDIFSVTQHGSPFVESAFIEVVVRLRDLLWKCEHYATRVAFADDVLRSSEVNDVTDAVTHFRDAVCHIDSDNNYAKPGVVKVTICMSYGKASFVMMGQDLGSQYPDDVTFIFGFQRLYLRRHVCRAFSEAKGQLLRLMT